MDGDVLLSMIICSLFLRDVPMVYREKVLLCIFILRWMERTEFMNKYLDKVDTLDRDSSLDRDIMWVNDQIKKMESEMSNVTCGTNSIEWNRTSDDEVCKPI